MRSVYVDGNTDRRKEGPAASGQSGLVGDAGRGLRHGLVKAFRVDCWTRCVDDTLFGALEHCRTNGQEWTCEGWRYLEGGILRDEMDL
jgi:hypothetical protein